MFMLRVRVFTCLPVDFRDGGGEKRHTHTGKSMKCDAEVESVVDELVSVFAVVEMNDLLLFVCPFHRGLENCLTIN